MAKFFLTPKGLIARFPWVQTPAWMVEAGVFYLMLGFARLLPFSVASGLFARALGWLGYRNAQKRRTVGRNLLHVLPEASDTKRDAVMRDIFRSTGRAAAELFLLERLWQNRTRHLEFSVHPEAEEIIARKEAIVFATAHVSAWQLCNLIGRERELTISVIYTPEPNPWLHGFFLSLRRAFGGPLVPSAGGARELLHELAAGRSVGAAFDTRVDQGEMVPFFGTPTPTSTLPALLAQRGYPLVPIRAVRLPNARFRIEVLAPLAPADPDLPRKERIFDMTHRLNLIFEDWIRDYPGEWICMKRRWFKTRDSAPKAPDA
ncbi:lysophospholipid acyltransferase family protein [Roseovarius mucosus]|uniref:lysophospholipid acyltransferase family protein n=1 Tax=Roseovarius mucosus TaxID=215743 RepID=UPI0035D06F31|tara:strand:- start:401 stop:1354 length:954 start_codon:yes stop_codon:yes gene_type:complete